MSQKERLRTECEVSLKMFMNAVNLSNTEQATLLAKLREWFNDLEKSFGKEQEVKTFPKILNRLLQIHARKLDIRTQFNLLGSINAKLKELLSQYSRFGRN